MAGQTGVMGSSLSVSRTASDYIKKGQPREIPLPDFFRQRLNHGIENPTRVSVPRRKVFDAGRSRTILPPRITATAAKQRGPLRPCKKTTDHPFA
jgi:hypothetical protein